jgi:hypothetical protein
MSNEKNNEVIGIMSAVALLSALTVTAGTVIYGAFGGYGSFYEMFLCFRPKRCYNVGYIRCDRAALLRDRRNYNLIWTALPERLEAPSHRNHISDTWAFDVLAVVRGSFAVETGDGIRSLG